jgi:hypothetical protein
MFSAEETSVNQEASQMVLSLFHFSTEVGGSKFLRNVCKLIPDYMALYSRRYKYSDHKLNSNEAVMGRVLISEVSGRWLFSGILNNTTFRKPGIFPLSGEMMRTHLISIVTSCVEGRIEIPIAMQRIELCIHGYN